MKKLLIVSVFMPLFLISCGKSEEVKTVANLPVVEKQIVVTGSIAESSTGKIEEVSSGVVSGDWVTDEISINLEKISPYQSFSWTEDKWVKYRLGAELLWKSSAKINSILLDNNFKPDIKKIWLINLFVVGNDDKFTNTKEVIQKYFINSKYKDYCTLNTIDTINEVTNISASEDFYKQAYVSENLFFGKDNWEIYTISMNQGITPEMTEKVLNNWYCFWVTFSAPRQYFIFKKGDLTKFLLINTTQDPYPFNPRSFEF